MKFSKELIMQFTKYWLSINADYNRFLEVNFYKLGNKIKIKKQNKGKFTEYCGGRVTDECILKGKNSSDPKIRKRATFAANVRKWNKS